MTEYTQRWRDEKQALDDLVEEGLVSRKHYDNGMNIYKYTRKTFFSNQWNESPTLLEARGHIYSDSGMCIQKPFHKTFNLFENNTLVQRDTEITAIRKINGFMAAITYDYDYGFVTSTTGTVDSDYAKMAEKWLRVPAIEAFVMGRPSYTFLFEIVDKDDPHIVKEKEGAYFLNARNKHTGSYLESYQLSCYATWMQCHHPEVLHLNMGMMIDMSTTAEHEGWMIYPAYQEYKGPLCKLKTPFYSSKKMLMRMSKNKVEQMFLEPDKTIEKLDSRFAFVVENIVDIFKMEAWQEMNDQKRRAEIEEMLK